jgi:hypothetical protein
MAAALALLSWLLAPVRDNRPRRAAHIITSGYVPHTPFE